MVNMKDSNEIPKNPSIKQLETPENGPKNEKFVGNSINNIVLTIALIEMLMLCYSRKRKDQRKSPAASIPVSIQGLDDSTEEQEESSAESEIINVVSGMTPAVSCTDQLREELSCEICLEICYEPSTTPCGHSFCKRCLRLAVDKCGKKCPKCRQLISNGRNCTVNTVLWNTIQLLFPEEVEARRLRSIQATNNSLERRNHHRITRGLTINQEFMETLRAQTR